MQGAGDAAESGSSDYTEMARALQHMNTTNTNGGSYKECKMRQYLLNNMLPALQEIGIPFEEGWMKAPARLVASSGDDMYTGTDTIQDKLFLPTEYEMFGANTNSNESAETVGNQGRLLYYTDNNRRQKYGNDNVAKTYWLASPVGIRGFVAVLHTGASSYGEADIVYAIAPVLCVG
jgi:hypothetical protein